MDKEPKIAILYIALGRYITFWKDFYISSEKYFINSSLKSYYVFTDNDNFDFIENNNVFRIKQEKLGWPNDTLLRFCMFLKLEEELIQYDYVFFFNANMQFIRKVGEEIFPTDENDNLVMGLHPAFCNKNNNDFSYERNPESAAYIPFGEGKYYVQGCLNGGTSEAYIKLCKECDTNIKKDLNNQIVALWHDESHLNKYILNKTPLILTEAYLHPEAGHKFWRLNPFIKIIQRDKSKIQYGGYDYLRGGTNNKISLIEYWIEKLNKIKEVHK